MPGRGGTLMVVATRRLFRRRSSHSTWCLRVRPLEAKRGGDGVFQHLIEFNGPAHRALLVWLWQLRHVCRDLAEATRRGLTKLRETTSGG
jgi:hypothetical protein